MRHVKLRFEFFINKGHGKSPIPASPEPRPLKPLYARSSAHLNHSLAQHLHAVNMLFASLKEKGALVSDSSSAVDTMNLGGLSGMVSLAHVTQASQKEEQAVTETIQLEYTVQTCGTTFHAPRDEELLAAMNSLGEQGWEVFSVAQLEGSYKVRLAAKRPLSAPVRRYSCWPG
jgi:hypothetical protein